MVAAILSLGLMGLFFGIGLAYAAKKFKVEVDPRQEKIVAVLPGANCGGCGYPGCGGFAAAVVEGKAPVGGCPVGKDAVAQKIHEIIGADADGENTAKIARLICRGCKESAAHRFDYHGIDDCRAAVLVSQGSKGCVYGCLGLGTCERVCPFEAIKVGENKLPYVDIDKCTGCGKCIDACPKMVLELVEQDKNVIQVLCRSRDKGADVRKTCKTGCIGCGLCAKVCPAGAVSVTDNLAVIDPEKCTHCRACVVKCPTKAIVDHRGELNIEKGE